MGISKDQAYKILGLEEGAPDFLVRSHYCRLANKYHPDKNPHNRDVALHKFQKIVDAYVRLQIEPDDCDQMKMKMILTELYAINEDILTDEYGSTFPDELDIGIPCTDIVPATSPPYSSSAFSEKGPYAEVLQDFMIRSYMSGGRRTKPSVNMTVDRKLEASDRAMELASKHADELLKDEEEERMKEEKRKQKNKKKKEAKKKKKGQTNTSKKKQPSSSSGYVIDDDDDDEDDVSDDIHSFLSDMGEGLDITGSFFSKVNVAINDQPIGSIGAETFTRGDSMSSTTSKSSISSKGSTASSVSENTCPSPKRSISNNSIEYSSTGNHGATTVGNKKASVDRRMGSVDCMGSTEAHLTKVTAAAFKKPFDTPKETIEKPLREIHVNDESLANGKGKSNNTGYHKERQVGKTQKSTYWGGDKVTFKPNPSNSGKYFQPDLPPRLAKLAQSKGGRQVYNINNDWRAGGTKYTYNCESSGSYDGGNTYIETEGKGRSERMTSSMDSTLNETAIVKNPPGTDRTKQYTHEAMSRNGAGNELDESRRMAVLGNSAAKEGQFHDAVMYFSKAIQHYPFDMRYYGNRSFCYEHLKDYKLALQDANEALRINEDWPKGHFRKGKALVGLQKYEEAEECFKMAVKHDPDYIDAMEQLQATQIKRLMEMGFSEEQSRTALSEYEDVDKAVESLILSDVDGSSDLTENERPQSSSLPGSDTTSESESPKQTRPVRQSIGNRLWVGNVNPAIITEGMLFDAFKRYVSVEGVHIIGEKYCAFVEFSTSEDTAIALEQMQDYCLEDCTLYLRVPDNPNYSQYLKNPKKSAPKFTKTAEECRFWRTNGCFFGEKCRYIHIPKNKGIDLIFKRSIHPSQTYWRK